MKKIVLFFLCLISLAVASADFQSTKITGTDFCIGISCITDWSTFSVALPGQIVVSSTSTFTGLKQAIDWINLSGTQPYLVIVDAGTWDITDTITVNASYPIAIKGLGFEVTALVASGGLENKPMFDIQSPCDFSDFYVDGSTLDGYGANAGEDGFKIDAGNGDFVQIQNVGIYSFNKGISLESDSEMRIFNSSLEDNIAYGAYLSGGDYRSAETDYNNSAVGIYAYAGTGKFFSSEHDSYRTYSGQVSIAYNPIAYTNFQYFALFNNNFITATSGIVLSGFNFALQRDANVELYGNIGIEDYRPHAKINLIAGATAQSLSSSTWTKVNYTLTDSFTKKRGITTTGKITFLSDHHATVQMWISATVSSSTVPSDMQFAIIKNGNTSTPYGIMNVYLDSAGRAFNFSQNIYLDDVGKDDYFELYMYAAGGGETVTLKNLNWYVDSR